MSFNDYYLNPKWISSCIFAYSYLYRIILIALRKNDWTQEKQ